MKLAYLSGGVGGARLLHGLHQWLADDALTAVVNTGDDFEHWGLRICPDLDTVMYTLAGLSDWNRGWGLRDEGTRAFSLITRYGAEDWFQLGDADLATHIRRTELLRKHSLTEVTAQLCRALGLQLAILPMSDTPLSTHMETRDGRSLPFQRWFVEEHCRPTLRAIRQQGRFQDNPAVLAALQTADVVLLGPSNPYVSIAPILGGAGTRALVQDKPVVAVSPLIGGRAVKGPLESMIQQLSGQPASLESLARIYQQLLGCPLAGLIIDASDGPLSLPCTRVHMADILMQGPEDSIALAREVLLFLEACVPQSADPGGPR